jgi:SsrA-binding protein
MALKNSKVKKNKKSKSLVNRRARFDFDLKEDFLFGLVLKGSEVRAIRENRVILSGSYIQFKDDELWWVGGQIHTKNEKDLVSRQIKILATKKDISTVAKSKNQGLTIVPIELINIGRYIKLRASSAKGRKKYDKRAVLKRKQFERDKSKI